METCQDLRFLSFEERRIFLQKWTYLPSSLLEQVLLNAMQRAHQQPLTDFGLSQRRYLKVELIEALRTPATFSFILLLSLLAHFYSHLLLDSQPLIKWEVQNRSQYLQRHSELMITPELFELMCLEDPGWQDVFQYHHACQNIPAGSNPTHSIHCRYLEKYHLYEYKFLGILNRNTTFFINHAKLWPLLQHCQLNKTFLLEIKKCSYPSCLPDLFLYDFERFPQEEFSDTLLNEVRHSIEIIYSNKSDYAQDAKKILIKHLETIFDSRQVNPLWKADLASRLDFYNYKRWPKVEEKIMTSEQKILFAEYYVMLKQQKAYDEIVDQLNEEQKIWVLLMLMRVAV